MNIALVFAGGTGTRMKSSGLPKQFLEINGKPIIIHTIEHFENHEMIDAICVVCHPDWIDYFSSKVERFGLKKIRWIVPGGSSGQKSIRNGLFAIAEGIEDHDDCIVLIHDGVRPLINRNTITDNINAVKEFGTSITTVPAIETIVRTDESENLVEVYDRSSCRLARAPQSFILSDILDAHKKLIEEGDPAVIDSAMLMVRYGHKLHMVEGPMENIKITTPSDFYILRALLEVRENNQIWGN